jgi:ATP-binding cassette subfamily G (WHITE) protein 2 (SNQ2)
MPRAVPLNALKILLFTVIIYFLAGLARTAGAFFTNYLFVLITYMVMSAFFRVLGTATRDYNVAARLASVLISFMVIYAGYMIPVFTMKRWLFWIYYLNPLSYGFEALMVNEFKRVDLQCDAAYIVPYGAGFPATVANTEQTCTLAGSTPGQNSVPGMDYASAAFDYATGHLWRNLGILIGFFIGFAVMQILAMEVLAMKAANVQAIVVFAKENKDTKERNERLIERKKAFQAGEIKQDLAGLIESKRALTWTGLVSVERLQFAPLVTMLTSTCLCRTTRSRYLAESDNCSTRSMDTASPVNSPLLWVPVEPERPLCLTFWLLERPSVLLAETF